MALAKIFNEKDTVFESDGNMPIKPLYAVVQEDLNGDYFLELELINEDVKNIPAMGIIAVRYKGSWQGFRIGNRDPRGDCTYFKCWHVSYDMRDYLIKDLDLDSQAFSTALQNIKNGTTRVNPFTFVTDIRDTVNADIHYSNLYDAIYALVEECGYYIIRDNYIITIAKTLGADNGVSIEDGNNLEVLDKYENVDDMVNELYPVVVFEDKEYGLGGDGYIADYTVTDRVYTKCIQFDQLRPEYYQALYEKYTGSMDLIDEYNAQISNADSNLTQLSQDKADVQTDISSKRQELSTMEQEFTTKYIQNTNKVNNILEDITVALSKMYQTQHERYMTNHKLLTSRQTTLTNKNLSLAAYEEAYKLQTSKTKRTQSSFIVASGYKVKAKVTKKDISNLKKEINTIETEIRKLEAKERTYTTAIDQIQKYQRELNSPEKLSSSDVTSILNCMNNNGFDIMMTVAEEYAEAQSNIEDKEAFVDDVNEKYEEIFNLKRKYDDLDCQIKATKSLIGELEDKVEAETATANTYLSELETTIRTDLNEQATLYLNKFKYPQATYEVVCLPVDVNLNDTVQVKNSLNGIDILTNVIQIRYDCIAERIDTLQFGNTGDTVASLQAKAIGKQTEIITKKQVLLENSYSNMMSKMDKISGMVAGVLNETVEDGTLVETSSKIEATNGNVSMKVSKKKAESMIETEVTAKIGEFRAEVSEDIIPTAISNAGIYSVAVTCAKGTIYTDEDHEKVITAKVVKADTDITDDLPDRAFKWTRKSGNEVEDEAWNMSPVYGSQLNLSEEDYDDNCTFMLDVLVTHEEDLLDSDDEPILDMSNEAIQATMADVKLHAEVPLVESFKVYRTMLQMLRGRALVLVQSDGSLAKIDMETGEEGSSITVSAGNINLEGLVTANGYFRILQDGSVETSKITIKDEDGEAIITSKGVKLCFVYENSGINGLQKIGYVDNGWKYGAAAVMSAFVPDNIVITKAVLKTGIVSAYVTDPNKYANVSAGYYSPKQIQMSYSISDYPNVTYNVICGGEPTDGIRGDTVSTKFGTWSPQAGEVPQVKDLDVKDIIQTGKYITFNIYSNKPYASKDEYTNIGLCKMVLVVEGYKKG